MLLPNSIARVWAPVYVQELNMRRRKVGHMAAGMTANLYGPAPNAVVDTPQLKDQTPKIYSKLNNSIEYEVG